MSHNKMTKFNQAHIVTDLKGAFIYVSPEAYSILGFTPEEVIGKSGFEFIHPDDLTITIQALKKAIKGEKDIIVKYRVRHKKGHYLVFVARGEIKEFEGKSCVVVSLEVCSEEEIDLPVKKFFFNLELDKKLESLKTKICVQTH